MISERIMMHRLRMALSAPHGLVAHIRLDLYLQVFANQSETVEEAELRYMLQGVLLLLGDLLIDESELEIAVDEEEGDETDDQDWQEPTATTKGGIEVEHLGKGLSIELHQQWPEGYQVEHDGGKEPQDVAIDECTEEQIDLAIEHDDHLTAHELHQYWPETCPCEEDDDRVGQEHGEPQEVVATEMGGDEKTLDGCIA